MNAVLAVLAVLVAAITPARAALTSAQLAAVEARPIPGARLPLTTVLRDEQNRPARLADVIGGQPALLIFADYTCRTLCGPVIEMAAAALRQSGLRPGRDFHLVVVGLDPADGPPLAEKMKAAQLAGTAEIAAAATFLSGDARSIAALTGAAGYRYAYDADNDQFAHPNVVMALTGDGRISRTLSALGLTGTDVRLALVEAGHGTIGGVADRLRLLCYGFDPAQGVYTDRILDWLRWAGALSVIALAGAIGLLHRRMSRRAS